MELATIGCDCHKMGFGELPLRILRLTASLSIIFSISTKMSGRLVLELYS